MFRNPSPVAVCSEYWQGLTGVNQKLLNSSDSKCVFPPPKPAADPRIPARWCAALGLSFGMPALDSAVSKQGREHLRSRITGSPVPSLWVRKDSPPSVPVCCYQGLICTSCALWLWDLYRQECVPLRHRDTHSVCTKGKKPRWTDKPRTCHLYVYPVCSVHPDSTPQWQIHASSQAYPPGSRALSVLVPSTLASGAVQSGHITCHTHWSWGHAVTASSQWHCCNTRGLQFLPVPTVWAQPLLHSTIWVMGLSPAREPLCS